MTNSRKEIRSAGRLSRRRFLGVTAAAAAALSVDPIVTAGSTVRSGTQNAPFKLRYAPSFGMFKGHAGEDLLDQIRFCADQGFRAMFDNGLMSRPPEVQEALAREMGRLDMMLGPFVAYADFSVESFVTRDPEIRKMLLERMNTALETARRTGARWTLVVPGRYNPRWEWDYQTAAVVDNLKFCAEICGRAGLTIVIEPLNRWDHPGLFLTGIPQAFQICRAVGSPSCKIINDIYHQQISEGNLIPNIDRSWEETASFHLGDNPGRKEPGTGEINYRNIFKHIHSKGYEGVLCMEHGRSLPGKEGEQAVIDAYRACDDF